MIEKEEIVQINRRDLKFRLAFKAYDDFIGGINRIHQLEEIIQEELEQDFLNLLRKLFKNNENYLNTNPILTQSLVAVIGNFLIFSEDKIFLKNPEINFEIIRKVLSSIEPFEGLNDDSFNYTGTYPKYTYRYETILHEDQFIEEIINIQDHYEHNLTYEMAQALGELVDSAVTEYINRRGKQYKDKVRYINVLNRVIRNFELFLSKFMPFVRFLSLVENGDEIGKGLFQRINLNEFAKVNSNAEA